jgi:hypothetical protein
VVQQDEARTHLQAHHRRLRSSTCSRGGTEQVCGGERSLVVSLLMQLHKNVSASSWSKHAIAGG